MGYSDPDSRVMEIARDNARNSPPDRPSVNMPPLNVNTRGRSLPISDLHALATTPQDFGLALLDTGKLSRLRAALVTETGAGGGYAQKPVELAEAIEIALLDHSAMRRSSTIYRRDAGDEFSIPTSDDTGNEGVIIASDDTAEDAADIEFGQRHLHGYKFSSRIIRVPMALADDSELLMATLGLLIGGRIGRRQNRAFTVGTGAGEPFGVVTAAQVGVTTVSPTVIAMDDVLSLIASVPSEYSRAGSLMMNRNTLLSLATLKDGEGRYLWREAGLDRYRLELNDHMPDIAANARPVLFGDLSKYVIRDRWTLNVKSLPTRYAEQGQIGFIGIAISDGNLLDAGAGPVKVLKMSA